MTASMRQVHGVIVCLVSALSAGGAPLLAQAPVTAREAFEVASVKPNPSNDAPESAQLTAGGGVRMTGFRVSTLIRLVYATPAIQRPEQIVGGPAWIGSERFDIIAKANGELTPDAEGRRPQRLIAMLRSLLEDRFAVGVHTEQRRMSALALQLVARDAKFGPQLRVSTAECPTSVATPASDRWCGFRAVGSTLTARNVTMPEVATYLSGYAVVGRPVEDRTGLSGRYDFELEFTNAFIVGPNGAPAPNPAADSGTGLFTALKEQLGLTLQPENALLPVLVIDRVEHPTPD
jgi:uncharacterized protein (TIGR03435 family)